MPLIIESYSFPLSIFIEKLFKNKTFIYLDKPMKNVNQNEFYYTRIYKNNSLTRSITNNSLTNSFFIENSRKIKYYFESIFYIEKSKIVNLNKISRKIKYYDLDTGKLIYFSNNAKNEDLDKAEFLPQLSAQDGELVIFPEEDD